MSYIGNKDFFIEVAKGNVAGHSLVEKFGRGSIGTSLVPVTTTLSYPTPTTATALEFVSSDANDTSAGSGAREVTVIGLDSNWAEVTQTVTTNGTTPVALSTNLIRLYRWYVSSSGTYATATTASHAGTLTIRESGGGTVWSQITTSPTAVGQSNIGCYTIPAGKTGYLLTKNVFVDGAKNSDIYFFQRPNADDVSSPYSGAFRLVEQEVGVSNFFEVQTKGAKGPFVGPCDVGFMAVATAAGTDVSVEFEILLVDN